jgi:hypothetical protein
MTVRWFNELRAGFQTTNPLFSKQQIHREERPMQKRDSAPHTQLHAQTGLCPFPYALYDSCGLLFELFEGGQPIRKTNPAQVTPDASKRFKLFEGGMPARQHQVKWERVHPLPDRQQQQSAQK